MATTIHPFLPYLKELATLEDACVTLLQRNHVFEDLPHPATGYYHLIMHIFKTLESIYETKISCDFYFYALRISFCRKEIPGKISDVWQSIYSPNDKALKIASELLLEVQGIFAQLRLQEMPDIHNLLISLAELEGCMEKAKLKGNWCPNIILTSIHTAANYDETEEAIFKKIRKALDNPAKIPKLAACKYTLIGATSLRKDPYQLQP